MKIIAFVLVSFALSLGLSAQNEKINSLTEKEKKEGWQLLFNGKNLDGWKAFQGKEVTGWKVIDGVLNNSGVGSDHGGDIVTRKKYQNFELSVEWKVASKSNSGIFYHVNEKLGKAIYETGPEYQLIDDKGWPDKLADSQYSGSNYAMNAPQNAQVKPLNEWNKTRIIVEGSHVQHYLNDVKVVDYNLWDDDWKARKEKGKWKDFPYYGMARKGQIGLQDHGGLAQFRNMKIREIK
jgi:uncharacterized protein YnzC (UPF0291/DUF896 family)